MEVEKNKKWQIEKKKGKRKIIFVAALSCLQKFVPKTLRSIDVKPQIWNLDVLFSWDKHFHLHKMEMKLLRRCTAKRQEIYDIDLGLSC